MNNELEETHSIQNEEGRYADAFRIGHSAYKFVFDFGQSSSPNGKPNFRSRIIMAPNNASSFFKMLEQSLKEYEEQIGEFAQSDE